MAFVNVREFDASVVYTGAEKIDDDDEMGAVNTAVSVFDEMGGTSEMMGMGFCRILVGTTEPETYE